MEVQHLYTVWGNFLIRFQMLGISWHFYSTLSLGKILLQSGASGEIGSLMLIITELDIIFKLALKIMPKSDQLKK